MRKKILVTGVAGFIGFHFTQKLLKEGFQVLGLDNINEYYDPKLKLARLKILKESKGFAFEKIDLVNLSALSKVFENNAFDVVVHLAAQAGVRYSISNPEVYIASNINGFFNLLEQIRKQKSVRLLYASSSSVYGNSTSSPFTVQDKADRPISLYAATKKSNELMAHAYSHLYQIPMTGLRFFTVYGPWGRPDMALFKFAEKIVKNEVIDVYNNGDMIRDFTYIDDVVESVFRLMKKEVTSTTNESNHRVFNIGSNNPVKLLDYIEILEKCLGMKSKRNLMPMQDGDVKMTFAGVDDLIKEIDFAPKTGIEEGIGQFVSWFKSYYKINT